MSIPLILVPPTPGLCPHKPNLFISLVSRLVKP